MDSWEFNKIAGAVLSALLLAFGMNTFVEMLQGKAKAAKPGYELPVTAAVPGKAAEPEKPFAFADVAGMLKSASAENGRDVFKRCAACHTPEKDGKPGQGPNLWGVLGRDLGTSATFPKYSAALKGKGGKWAFDNLAVYLHDPKGAIPGNQMAFVGVKDNAELADLLAYLRTLSDSPLALP